MLMVADAAVIEASEAEKLERGVSHFVLLVVAQTTTGARLFYGLMAIAEDDLWWLFKRIL